MVSQHALQVSRPTPRREVERSGQGGWGYSRPTPSRKVEGFGQGGLQAHTREVSRPTPEGVYIPACTEADPSPSRRLLLRAVRILLECILVVHVEIHRQIVQPLITRSHLRFVKVCSHRLSMLTFTFALNFNIGDLWLQVT